VSHEELLLAYIDPQGGGYETEQLSELYRDLLARIEAPPPLAELESG